MKPSLAFNFNCPMVNFIELWIFMLLFEPRIANICFVFSIQLYSEGEGTKQKNNKKNRTITLHSHKIKEDPTVVKLNFSSLGHEQTMNMLSTLYFRMIDEYGPWFKLNAHVHTHIGIEYTWTSYAFLEIALIQRLHDRCLRYSQNVFPWMTSLEHVCFGCYLNYTKKGH